MEGGAGHRYDSTYVADEIFAPLVDELENRARAIFPYVGDVSGAAADMCKPRLWLWPETLGFVAKVWRDIDPVYGDEMTEFIASGFFHHAVVPYGQTRGAAGVTKVTVHHDQTINGAMCALHESGHLMAYPRKGNPLYWPWEAPSPHIRELQSLFVQEHGYKILRDRATSVQELLAVRLQRLDYYLNQLVLIPPHLWALDLRPAPGRHSRSLSQHFSHWSINQKLMMVFNKRQLKHNVQSIHLHPFACLVAPVLHALFMDADAAKKQTMLQTLYKGGADTHLMDVLNAFDIRLSTDLKMVGMLSCTRLADEISQCGFGPRSPKTPLSPNIAP